MGVTAADVRDEEPGCDRVRRDAVRGELERELCMRCLAPALAVM